MTFDVCMVTYNSAKWIPACVRALAKAEYDLKCINLYFADNSSTDDTILVLERQKKCMQTALACLRFCGSLKTGALEGEQCGGTRREKEISFFL